MRNGKMMLAAGLFLLLLPLASAGPGVGRAANDQPADENGAIIIGEAGEHYPIYGTGGIKVTGGHHGMWMSNMKRSTIEIDGSGISVQRLLPANVNADFNASPNIAYFVSQRAVCTLPAAAAAPGQEVIVTNANDHTTITYQTSNGEKLIDSTQSGASANSTFGKVDRFLSDGRNWYRE
jgi:hypothetical protein